MTISSHDGLRAEIRSLGEELSTLSPQGKATVFAVCGRSLKALLSLVETHTGGRWAFPSAEDAIAQVESYALGLSYGRDHAVLRAHLMELVPDGNELDTPWSTYAQDAITCIDAGLAASSIVDSCKGAWIQYSIEPLVMSLQYRDEEIIISRGEEYWERGIVADLAMMSAISFLRSIISEAGRATPFTQSRYNEFVGEAIVLIPAAP